MNTAKWGPPGWDQFGPAADRYDFYMTMLKDTGQQEFRYGLACLYKLHFSITETQLPCKYCRASFHQYIRELPPDSYLMCPIMSSKMPLYGCFNTWMYKVHNKVNNKLRTQGYNTDPDPSPKQALKYVRKTGTDLVKSTGWDFIHSIAHNYPTEPTAEDKINKYLYVSALPYMLPHPLLTQSMLGFMRLNPIDDCLDNRPTFVLWMYLLHRHLLATYTELGAAVPDINEFGKHCQYYESFRAKCGVSAGKKGASCRLPVSSKVKNKNLELLLARMSI